MKDAAAKHMDTSEILNDRRDSASAEAARLSIDDCSRSARLSNDSCSCLNAGSSSSVRGSYESCSISRAASPSTRFVEDGPKMSSDSGSLYTPFPALMDALSTAGLTMAIVCMLLSIISLVIRRAESSLVVVILAALVLVLNVGTSIAISLWCKKNLNKPNQKQ